MKIIVDQVSPQRFQPLFLPQAYSKSSYVNDDLIKFSDDDIALLTGWYFYAGGYKTQSPT